MQRSQGDRTPNYFLRSLCFSVLFVKYLVGQKNVPLFKGTFIKYLFNKASFEIIYS